MWYFITFVITFISLNSKKIILEIEKYNQFVEMRKRQQQYKLLN